MHKLVCYIVLFLVSGVVLAEQPTAESLSTEKPKIVVTIKPLALIAKSAVGELAAVEFIQAPGLPSHDLRLKFSQLKKLNEADLVIWVGEAIEGRLGKRMASFDEHKVIEAMELEMNWPGHIEHAAGKEGHDHFNVDPHFWLNPANANVLAQEIRTRLGFNSELKPLLSREELVAIEQELMPYKDQQYIAHHDAYRHFTEAFGLMPGKAFRDSSGAAPGIKAAYAIRSERAAACIFAEPQYSKKEVISLGKTLDIPVIDLDLQGTGIALDNNAYPEFIRQFIAQYKRCFVAAQ